MTWWIVTYAIAAVVVAIGVGTYIRRGMGEDDVGF